MRDYPMPMPFGWFQVAWSDEVPTGTSKPMQYFGRHLVAWRGEGGEAHVWDAFCPHLGAHLGGNAAIQGDTIRNKRNLEARDENDRRQFRDQIREAAADPEKGRALLRRIAMFDSLERAASLEPEKV